MESPRHLPLLSLFYFTTIIVSPCAAFTWYVDGSVASSGDRTSWGTALKTVQEGIAAAGPGCTVMVAPGTYVERITIPGRAITVRSVYPLDEETVQATILDAREKGPVVTFASGARRDSVLSGFTITGGRAFGETGYYGGGGVLCEQGSNPTISYNIITGNSARNGAGIYCGAESSPLISRSRLVSNSAEWRGGGILCSDGSAPEVANTLIYGNSAGEEGGGIYWNDSAAIMTNCTIAHNHGGGIHFTCAGKEPTVTNCIVWRNGYEIETGKVTYSCVHGGYPDEGNICLNPHFRDPANGDYHLLGWSPCTDSGDPSCEFKEEPQPNGSRVNMGAYGNTPEAASKSLDTDRDGLADDWELHFFGHLGHSGNEDIDGDEITNLWEWERGTDPAVPPTTGYVRAAASLPGDGKSWETGFRTIQEGINAASDGERVLVWAGHYNENIDFLGKGIIVQSAAPGDARLVEQTVIDGGGKDIAVCFSSWEGPDSVLSGFTITGGQAESA